MRSPDVTLPRSVRGAEEPPAPILQILSTPQPTDGASRVPLVQGASVTVGRADDASIVLRDGRVSRKHVTLTLDGDSQITLVDSSANGTALNGRTVKRVVVSDGDVIRIGDTFLMVRFVPAHANDLEVPGLIGTAPSMSVLRSALGAVVSSDAGVLVLGESGTGAELIARAIHDLSGRDGAFVAVSCASSPEPLLESELFGQLKSAGGDPSDAKTGAFRAAAGGTLFIDELGELPPLLQPILLRSIEDAAVTPVGATTAIPCNVRVVAAADRDIERRVREKMFRADLYARLAAQVLYAPPLRDRREDIIPLLLDGLGETDQKLEPDLIEALLAYKWPYNVRELSKVAKELRIRGQGEESLGLALVEARLRKPDGAGETGETMQLADGPQAVSVPVVDQPKKEELPPPTRDMLVEILTRSRGNISQVSRETGRSRRQVYRYLEEHGLTLEDFRDDV